MHKKKDYLTRKKQIIDHFNKKGVTRDLISEYCMFSFVPIAIVCEFIIEEIPEHKELCEGIIDDINDFYGGNK